MEVGGSPAAVAPPLPEVRGRNAQKLEAPGQVGRALADERSGGAAASRLRHGSRAHSLTRPAGAFETERGEHGAMSRVEFSTNGEPVLKPQKAQDC